MTTRTLKQVIDSVPASDGAGVKLRRSLGRSPALRVDPFLMLDEFFSDDPKDYLAGFPSHPHRGFETVTYMLDGHMRHEDHLGNRGVLGPGAVQWMTAGRGIVHSEMPQQLDGRMRGFQLWINLPASEKMKPAHYRDVSASDIPVAALPGGAQVKVIAGTLSLQGRTVPGPIREGSVAPLYFDVVLPADGRFEHEIEPGHNAFAYVYEGSVDVGARTIGAHTAAVFSDGLRVDIVAGRDGARLLLIAGRPLREPVAQYGPFVMNTREELERAVEDYREGRLVEPVGQRKRA